MPEQLRFILSRPHSSRDHRRNCAVIGCHKRESVYSKPLCKDHNTNDIWRQLDVFRAKVDTYVKTLSFLHGLKTDVPYTDRELDTLLAEFERVLKP